MHTDSTGHPIHIGDHVRFRGYVYTIRGFRPQPGNLRVYLIDFRESQHTTEQADEVSVDLLPGRN